MNKNKILVLIFIILLTFLSIRSISGTNTLIEAFNTENYLYVGGKGSGNYSTINDALYNASNGDTVFVYSGTYNESYLIVDKKINLIGEHKRTTIIDGCGAYKILQIFSDNVKITGFTFRNITSKYDIWYNSLIEINLSENVTIENNILFNQSVRLPTQQPSGICIIDSKNCFLKNNSMFNCSIMMWGLKSRGELDCYIHDIDTTNTVNNKPIYYYKNCENITIPNNAGQVYLVSCKNCKVSNLNISDASYSIHICYSNYNIIEYNAVKNCVIGIMFDHSHYNIIRNNTITDIFCGGIFFDFSDYNIIEHNNISDHMGAMAFEMYSDYNIVRYNSLKSDGSVIFFDNSDYNKIYSNNIYGTFLGLDNKHGRAALMWGKSHHNLWDNNFWVDRIFFKKFPRIIIGMHHSLYDSLLDKPSKPTFPSYIKLDRNPASEAFKI